MKAKEKEEKDNIKLRYAVALSKALSNSHYNSFRDLALQSGLEPAHIQRISAGKVDVALSTSISLAEGLGISYTELSAYYDAVTDKDIQEFLQITETRKRKRDESGVEKKAGGKIPSSKKKKVRGRSGKK